METLAPKKSFSRLGLALFIVLAVTVLLQVIVGAILAAASANADMPSWLLWLGNFLPLYAVAIPIGLAVMKKVPAQRTEDSALGAGRFIRVLIVCFPIMYIGNLIGTLLSSVLSSGQAANPLEAMVGNDSWLRFLVIPILAPIFEEYLFRKQLIDRSVKYGEKNAMVFSALCFGLFHMNLFQFFYAFGLGLVFAYVYIRTRRLRYTVILHILINFLGSVFAPWLMGKADFAAISQLDPVEAVQAVTPWTVAFMLYAVLLLGLSVAGIVILLKSRRKLVFLPAEEELEKGERFRTIYVNVGFILFFLICLVVIVLNLLGM